LSASGSGDLDKFAMVYQQLAARLPPDLPVIIEVQGHTDRTPIRAAGSLQLGIVHGARAGSGELSDPAGGSATAAGSGRDGGISPYRCGGYPEAYRRNRRIELKITSR
jgi:chemotaxis protein MotB